MPEWHFQGLRPVLLFSILPLGLILFLGHFRQNKMLLIQLFLLFHIRLVQVRYLEMVLPEPVHV